MAHEVETRLQKLKLRTFQLEDYSKVRSVWKESGLEIRPGDSRKEIQRKLKRDPELFLVAEFEGKIVATVMGAWDGRRGWIYHLGVVPAFQRKGIANRLVREVERRMKAKGVLKVNASIYKWNKKSLTFFKASGYGSDDETVHVGKYLRVKTRQSGKR